ncbi:MAG: pyrroline-5-carboxylate reductase [Chloroflexi bacterium]|nr:MAG: pyrroline-5-carboxylate reductase [Chloroflexota bacterium]
MNEPATIAIIGPGAMAEAIISGLLRKEITTPDHILAAGPRKERVDELHGRYGIRGFTDNRAAARHADIVILAIKPQRLSKVLPGLAGAIREEALVLSIIAGATIQTLSDGLKHTAVARSMPNTPAQIGEGITVWTTSPSVSAQQREQACQILSALGEEVYVEEESYLDMATALSGTGPAYVFLFMEALIDAGVHMGFPRRIAEQLVTETILGSVSFYEKNKTHPAQLRNQVTSPGGTTAAAMYYLEKAGFRTALSRAIWAAYERSMELGKGLNAHPPESKD